MMHTDEQTRAAEFTEFVQAMPPDWHMDLYAQDTVPTALVLARGKGWTMQQLIDDALATRRRGQGIGMLVTRLRSLASVQPPKPRKVTVGATIDTSDRPDLTTGRRIMSHPFEVETVPFCKCGLPSANRVHTAA